MTKKTTQSKGDLLKAITGSGQPERATLAENRDKIFEKFVNNLRVLLATERISMVELAKEIGMKSGTRIHDLSYGRGKPTTEELIALSSHFKCTLDDLLNRTVVLSWV